MPKGKDSEVKTVEIKNVEEQEECKKDSAQAQTTGEYTLQVIFEGLCAIVPGRRIATDRYEGITVLVLEEKGSFVRSREGKLPGNDRIRRGEPTLLEHKAKLSDGRYFFNKELGKHDLRITVGEADTELGNEGVEFYRGDNKERYKYSLDHVIDMGSLYKDESNSQDRNLKVESKYINSPIQSLKLAARMKLGGVGEQVGELAAYSDEGLSRVVYYFRDANSVSKWSEQTGLVDGVIFTLRLTEPTIKLHIGRETQPYTLSSGETLTIHIKNEPDLNPVPHDNGSIYGQDPIENYPIDYDFLLSYDVADLKKRDNNQKLVKIPRINPSSIRSFSGLEEETGIEQIERVEQIERTEHIEVIETLNKGKKTSKITTTSTEVKTITEPAEKHSLSGRDYYVLYRPMICNIVIFSGE